MQEFLRAAILSTTLILGLLIDFPLVNLSRNLFVALFSTDPAIRVLKGEKVGLYIPRGGCMSAV